MVRRDTLVNALLGILLLLAFSAYVSAFGLIAWCGFAGLESILRHVAPDASQTPYLSLIAVWVLAVVWKGVGHARKRRWRNSFLSLALPLFMAALVVTTRSSIVATREDWMQHWWLPMMMMLILGVANDANIGRLKFLLATAIICAVVSANSGLLGNAVLAHAVGNSILLVAILWLCLNVVSSRYATPNHSLAPPPTGA